MDMTSNSNSNKYPFHSTINFDRGKMTKFYYLAPQDINSYKVVKKCETFTGKSPYKTAFIMPINNI